jgi:hypothetical protein
MLEVKMVLLNCSWCEEYSYRLHLLNDPEKVFLWRGTDLRTGQLKPGEQAELTLGLLFQKSGLFDVNKWQLEVVPVSSLSSPSYSSVSPGASDIYSHEPSIPCFIRVTF